MAAYTQILETQKDGVLTLTLNRPERLNAWTPTMAAVRVQTANRPLPKPIPMAPKPKMKLDLSGLEKMTAEFM